MTALDFVARRAVRVGSALQEADRWIRIHFLGFTALWPLLGAASARPDLEAGRLAGLFGVAFCFHVFGILLNDAVDLPVDRQQPSRAADPLVRGILRPAQAVMVAIAMIPCAFLIARFLDGGGSSRWSLAAAFAGMAIYDIWGKRCVVPPVTDGIQGLAWASLAFWGALSVGGALSSLIVVVMAYAVGYLLLINGVHGGLRDLTVDLQAGSRTTAIFLGIEPGPNGRPIVPRLAWAYCMPLQVGLVLLTLAPLLSASSWLTPVPVLISVSVTLCAAVNVSLMVMVLRPDLPWWQAAFRLHLFTLILPLAMLVIPRVTPSVGWVLVMTMVAPLSILEWTPRILAWLFKAGGAVTAGVPVRSGSPAADET